MLVKLVHLYIIIPQRPIGGLIWGVWGGGGGGVGGGGVEHDIDHCHFVSYFFFLQNLQLNIGKKYLKTAMIIDESLIHAIVSRNYSTKPSYIFQLKRGLEVWKYIFNLFHFEVLIQNRNPKFRSLSLFVLTFHEYMARFVFVFCWIINCPCLSFCLFWVKLFCVLFMCYNQYIS